jgi:glutaredoxin
MLFARPLLAAGLMGFLAFVGISNNDANAQQVYRIVGPDGRITFTDQAPLQGNSGAANASALSIRGGAVTDVNNLPFELRQATTRYPVTLYTAPGCGPCGAGRSLLSGRGVPYTERTVTTNEDIEALKNLTGAATVPFLTIGGQQLKGFAESEWVQFLDAAGYPKTSQLPATYSPAPASPLVAVQDTRPAPRAAATQAVQAPAPPPIAAQPEANSTGIRF